MEFYVTGEDDGELNARVLRDQAAIQRVNELNVERRRKGERRFADSFPHKDISNILFREFHISCEMLFKVEQGYMVERIKLSNTVFMPDNDTFSSFYTSLSAQVALCNWPYVQKKENVKRPLHWTD